MQYKYFAYFEWKKNISNHNTAHSIFIWMKFLSLRLWDTYSVYGLFETLFTANKLKSILLRGQSSNSISNYRSWTFAGQMIKCKNIRYHSRTQMKFTFTITCEMKWRTKWIAQLFVSLSEMNLCPIFIHASC